MDWIELLNPNKLGNRPVNLTALRSPFLADYDKIIFSQAFRRLARKTQVHPLAENDHIHNRLTHSLEVASIGRSLGEALDSVLVERYQGLHSFHCGHIVQAACLAHDIGIPPFGHIGEQAIGLWFSQHPEFIQDLTDNQRLDLIHFEGNAQGFRLLTACHFDQDGSFAPITYATLATYLKYPWGSCHPQAFELKKYSCFEFEQVHLHEIAQKTGMIADKSGGFYRYPLAYLVEAADDICYALLDLEDGLALRLISWQQMLNVFEPVLALITNATFTNKLEKAIQKQKFAYIRGEIMAFYIESITQTFFDHEAEFLKGMVKHSIIELAPPAVAASIFNAKNLAKTHIFSYPVKQAQELGAFTIIHRLLDQFIPAVQAIFQGVASSHQQMLVELIGVDTILSSCSQYEVFLRTIDFISGMTDNYALKLSQHLNGLN